MKIRCIQQHVWCITSRNNELLLENRDILYHPRVLTPVDDGLLERWSVFQKTIHLESIITLANVNRFT